MNLFRRHKKFEEQLKEQLGDMEYKPSTSLWDRIDSDITKDRFETGVKSSLENFEQVPYSDTWDKIAAELPVDRTTSIRKRRYAAWSILSLVFVVGFWFGYNQPGPSVNRVDQPVAVKSDQAPLPSGKKTFALPQTATSSEKSVQTQLASEGFESKQGESGNAESNRIEGKDFGDTEQAKESSSSPATKSNQASSDNVSGQSSAISIQEASPLLPVSKISSTEKVSSNIVSSNLQKVLLPASDSMANQMMKQQIAAEDNPTAAPTIHGGREITTIINPDSVTATSNFIASKKQDELTSFSISILAGAHVSFMTYTKPSDPQFDFDGNIALRKKLERPDIDWSGGFLIDYRLSKRWMISSGLMMINFNQQFDYSTVPASNPVNPGETVGAVYSSKDSVISGNGYSNRIKYSWSEIPVYVSYTLRKGDRWDISLQGGVGYAFINAIDAGMIAQDNKGVFALKDKDAFPNIQNAVFLSLMPQLAYRFGQNVSIGFVPTFKCSVTSMIANDHWVQQYPYMVGANICLRKRF